MKELTDKIKNTKDNNDYKKINISWGRQGGVIIGYVIIVLGFFGFIANSMMFSQYGDWISYDDNINIVLGLRMMDKTLLFWTYSAYVSPFLNQTVYFSILIVLFILIIVFSIVSVPSHKKLSSY